MTDGTLLHFYACEQGQWYVRCSFPPPTVILAMSLALSALSFALILQVCKSCFQKMFLDEAEGAPLKLLNSRFQRF